LPLKGTAKFYLQKIQGQVINFLESSLAVFGLFRSLVDRVPWEEVLKGKGVQEGWTLFKEEI